MSAACVGGMHMGIIVHLILQAQGHSHICIVTRNSIANMAQSA